MHACKRVIRVGSSHVQRWFNEPAFREHAKLRCDVVAIRHRCTVELRSADEVLYKIFV